MKIKNVFQILAIIALVMGVSCKDANKAKENGVEAMVEVAEEIEETTDAVAKEVSKAGEAAADKIEETADNVKEEAEKLVDGLPTFESKEVMAYVKSYESYMADYKKVLEDKNMTAMASLTKKGNELSKKASELTKDLNAEDAAKLSDYLAKKAGELQEMLK
jgi:hypothetical protein